MSIVYFLDGYFGSENIQGKKQVFRLHGLDESNPFYKKRFEDLSESYQRKLRSAVLRAINIRQLNPKGPATSIYHIFERLNTGGTPLKPQEIRNCVFRGPLVTVLRDLNRDRNWRTILGKRTFDRHQKDLELILRIFAFAFFFDEYEKPMKEFLNNVMDREKKAKSAHTTALQKNFKTTAERIVQALGDRPFHLRGRLNSAALDAVFSTLLRMKGVPPKDLAKRYAKLIKDGEFTETTLHNTSDSSVIRDRFDATAKYLVS